MTESLSDRMLRENAAIFAQMVDHRFVKDIRADRLPARVFDRYLAIEGAFVETAISIFALGTAKADCIAAQRQLIAVLDALANRQIVYFERVFTARRISPSTSHLTAPGVAAFRDGMRALAETGGYADIVTAMFAAEWMYWTWCSDAATARIVDPDLRNWVDLHAAPDFEAQARWLKAEVDRAGATLAETEKVHLVHLFGKVQHLEIGFHEAAYADPGHPEDDGGG
ncbi:TenA family protein [Palleronia sp. KMU-117]|uniref:TenA family protein n=1 Tax=Palleronia sp. KMU-117 TaxID=3434108 RepID=UPI003D761489